MSENDSQRPQDAGHAGETQQQPRVQVESTPAGSNIPYVQAYDTQTGQPPALAIFSACGFTPRSPPSRWAASRL